MIIVTCFREQYYATAILVGCLIYTVLMQSLTCLYKNSINAYISYSSKSYQIEKNNAYFSWYSNQGIKHNFNQILKEL